MPIITPIAKPQAASEGQTSNAQSAARQRAIALIEGASKPSPVPNPSKISVEEMGALKTQSKQEDEEEILPIPDANLAADDGQSATLESEAAVSEEVSEAPKQPEKTLSSEYAILARKEKALRLKAQQQDSALKAREQALKAREEALTQKDSQYSQGYIAKDRLTNDPWSVLAEAGVSYEQITQQAMNAQTQDPQVRAAMQELKDQIKALKDEQQNIRKSSEEQQSKAYKDALEQIRFEAKNLVSKDPAFESIKETGGVNEVVDLIERTFKEDGVLMTVEEACQAVEEEVSERLYNYTNKISKLKKRFEPQAQAAPSKSPANPAAAPAKSPQLKTLTNSVGSSRQLTARERAIMAFKGERQS